MPEHRVQSNLRRSSRAALRAAALALLGSVGALVMALGIEACGSDSGTSGERVRLATRVTLADDALSFETAQGWHVTLSRALISTGPFYYFDGAPPLVQLDAQPRWQRAVAVLGVGSAFAHPGHYKAGEALGQMLDSWSVDLLAGPADLPTGEGVTGLYRSASFSFTAPPQGPMAGELAAHAAVVEGLAERAGEAPRRFRAVADLADVERSAADGYVDGCQFDELGVEGDGLVTVAITPKVWFDLVDFSELAPASDDSALEFPRDSQPQIAFALGLAQLSAYEFSFAPAP
jgi:hypothetical protein